MRAWMTQAEAFDEYDASMKKQIADAGTEAMNAKKEAAEKDVEIMNLKEEIRRLEEEYSRLKSSHVPE